MRRRRVIRREDGINLFPFLAVLICTMGSLIVLLVIVVQQAKANAADVSQRRERLQQDLNREVEELRQRKEEFEWRIDVLETSRAETAQQLEDRRRVLSHLEVEIQELGKQLDRAVAEAERIAQRQTNQVADEQVSRQEADHLRDAIRRAQEELALARKDLAQRKRSYSIVPYKGPHGTDRRPVFVECLNDRIVLQPEGIELTSRDFVEPLTDENPLAAALRAKREYLARTLQAADGEPYPLLIVRPDGAASYAAARAAMKSWDAEFGYELVESDIQLNYPKRDPLLTKALEQTVRQARARRRHLQAIAPARFGRQQQGPATFTASHHGGFVRQGGDESGRPDRAGQPSFGADSTKETWPQGGNRPGGTGHYPPAGLADVGPGDRSNGARAAEGPAAAGQGDGFDAVERTGDHGADNSFSGAGHATGGGGDYSRANDPLQMNSPADPAADHGGNPADGNSGPTGKAGTGSAQSSRTAAHGTPSNLSSPKAAIGGSPGASLQSSAQSSPSGIGSLSGGLAPPSAIAQSRGADWGLPERSAGATGITRPIQLVVARDRLELLPENRRLGKSTRVPIEGGLREEIDQLIAAIWKRMDGWGIAGAGMYWKPVLSVQVRPGAEARFQEFKALMENSGLVVQRKQK